MKNRRTPLLVIAITLTALAGTAQKQRPTFLRMTFQELVERERTDDAEGDFEPRAEATWTATLGPRTVVIERGNKPVVLDYERGNERVVDQGTNTYLQYALYAQLAFAQMEQNHRQHQRRTLGAAGVETAAMQPFELAVLFGIPATGDEVVLKHKVEQGTVRYLKGTDVVTTWQASEHELGDDQRQMMRRLLHRTAHLHPKVREALVATARVPERLTFRWHDVGVRATATWTLQKVTTVEAHPVDTSKARRVHPDDELGQLARWVLDDTDERRPERLTAKQLLEAATQAGDAKRFEDAMLLLLEAGLSTGDKYTPQLRSLFAKDGAKQALQSLAQAIGSANQTPKEALESLQAVDDARFTRPEVLNVFRASARQTMRQSQAARALLLKALARSPWLTMAYKDVGDSYFSEFNHRDCWRAWEIGRHIAPAHSCWQDIRAFEEHLKQEFRDLL